MLIHFHRCPLIVEQKTTQTKTTATLKITLSFLIVLASWTFTNPASWRYHQTLILRLNQESLYNVNKVVYPSFSRRLTINL